MYEKLKSFLVDDAFFFSVLLILVGVISFGLGRQSVAEKDHTLVANQSAGVIFTESAMPEVVAQQEVAQVVVSRSGTKYYLLDCSGVSRIKEENKVYFDSIDLALAAGYTPASNCPGLQ